MNREKQEIELLKFLKRTLEPTIMKAENGDTMVAYFITEDEMVEFANKFIQFIRNESY